MAKLYRQNARRGNPRRAFCRSRAAERGRGAGPSTSRPYRRDRQGRRRAPPASVGGDRAPHARSRAASGVPAA